ncbi:adenylate/guanylate cyclase domain-containing protein [Marinifilum caeruleilacunae]|uniref:Adenylate/guanylate cyclase domain-containing protein n=1 Tax=Marinifilum caeruleilacunae TaxID=2499076 RepID=A0ABX1WSZ6_9BACT|nr:adenylate/guanylate cyclase domain-containing protein [Marinifilum caeruleilacunae]NOU59044.1 adenylate/guanylate cyclase domain-containing protein [Marinifilum caeruleilacunae]
MFRPHDHFSESLHPEFLRIERKRVGIILGLFIFGSLILPVLHYLAPNLLRNFLNQDQFFTGLVFWWLLFCVFELAIYFRLTYAIKNNLLVPKRILILNIIVEFGLPAIVLYHAIKYDYSLLILEYDGLLFYFLLLMLSAMHLDFKVSAGAGLLAGLGYFLVAFWGIEYLQPEDDVVQLKEIYTMRSFGLFVAGLVAGVVASEIKKRVNNYLNSIEEQKEIESLLGQQLSKDVANELIVHRNDTVGHKVVGSIMFLDIRNFTVMADHQSPEETIAFQNAIFDPLIRIIEKNNGIIHQILGDGFMASFGIAGKNENHAKDSLHAGLEIIEVINHLRTDENGGTTRVGIGLHSGEVVTGNIGNEIRKQFSIAGKNVIMASRIEQLNKNFKTQFLVSGQFVEMLNCKGCFKDLGEVHVKGFDDEVQVYQVGERCSCSKE